MDLSIEIKKYLEFCEHYKQLNTKTLKAYRIDLNQFIEYIRDDIVSKSITEVYLRSLHIKFKPRTVKRKVATLKAFFNYLEDEEILLENPFRKIKIKFREAVILPRIIQRTDIEKLLNKMYLLLKDNPAKKSKYIIRDIAIVELLFATGIRVSELSNIKIDDIDLIDGVIRIMGKGAKERYVQIGNRDVLFVVNQYYTQNVGEIENGGFFFVNQRGKRYTEQSIRIMLKQYAILAGIKVNITPHMFRHSFATYLLEEGVDISYIQNILGHSSIRTTQIYLHIASEKKAEILRSMHPRNHMNIENVA